MDIRKYKKDRYLQVKTQSTQYTLIKRRPLVKSSSNMKSFFTLAVLLAASVVGTFAAPVEFTEDRKGPNNSSGDNTAGNNNGNGGIGSANTGNGTGNVRGGSGNIGSGNGSTGSSNTGY